MTAPLFCVIVCVFVSFSSKTFFQFAFLVSQSMYLFNQLTAVGYCSSVDEYVFVLETLFCAAAL